jgi:hypothetical protein
MTCTATRGREAISAASCEREGLAVGCDPVDQAESQGALGVDQRPEHHQLFRRGCADPRRQPLRPAATGNQP